MRFFEFSITPATSSKLTDLEYLLKNGDVSTDVLQNALKFLKKNNQNSQQVSQKPSLQKLEIPADAQIKTTGPDLPHKNIKENSDGTDLRTEVMEFAKTAPPDALQKVLYYISLDSFKNTASTIIKSKIKVKADAITEQIHLAIGDLAGKVSVKIMTDFLNDCVDGGVVDCPSMITPKGKLQPIPITKNEYANIIKRLLETNLGGASASGRGEFGLAFAGINTTKGEKDITINGVDVEVKATRRKKDFFFKGQTGYESTHSMKALSELVNKLNSVGGKFEASSQVGKGGISQINPLTLVKLQPYFARLGQSEVQNLLVDMIAEIHSDQDVSSFNRDLISAVNADGTVDYNKLLLATSKISFYYYQQIENHLGVLMLDITNLTYDYQEDAADFAKSVASGIVGATSAIDFRNSTKGSLTFKIN